MSIGFTPKYLEELPLGNLTPQQFFVISIETAERRGWDIIYISRSGFIASGEKGHSEISIKINSDSAIIKSISTGSEIMDLGRNKKIVQAFILELESAKSALNPADLDEKYKALELNFKEGEEDLLTLPPATTSDHLKNFFAFFIPVEGYFVTPLLIDINIVLFILMILGGGNIMEPSTDILLKWGANFRPVTLEGEWWRLITCCFLHIGIIHLLFNMYALLYIGILLEPLLGKTRFFVAYMLTGIASSMASLWWHDLTVSAGASGAIFGMYGVFLALLTTDFIEAAARKTLLSSIGIFVGYNLLFGLRGGVDNSAHIGGLISGLLIGYAFVPALKQPEKKGLNAGIIGILCAVIIAGSYIVYKKLPNDIGQYDKQIVEFGELETKSLKVYNFPENTSDEVRMQFIKDTSVVCWNKNIELIDSFKKLDLPEEIKTRNKLLREYSVLRLKAFDLLYKTISEKTENYMEEMRLNNEAIENKLKEINGE